MYGDDSSDQGPPGTFESYRAEADILYKNGEYIKAIESYTTALEIRQGDKDCLVARSKCYLQLGNADHALQDAESSLSEDGQYHKGLYQKAEALYCRGEFEMALVFYHRGHKLRSELQEFRLGIQKAQEAIDNSVGSPEKVTLTKEGDLSFFAEQTDPKKSKPKGKTYSTYQKSAVKKKKPPPASVAKDKTVKQLLGELYGDRLYLENLLKETDPNSDSGKSIYDLVCDGLNYLDTRTDFWRQQKPMYARQRERMMKRQGSKGRQDPGKVNEYIAKTLVEIDDAQTNGHYAESLRKAKKCMATVDTYSEDEIRNKTEIIASLHSSLGNAYLELGDAEAALSHHQNDLDLSSQSKHEEGKSRALDNLGRVYARKGQYKKAIDIWSSKIDLTKSELENTWLFHEIGRCHLELGNFNDAKSYGDKALASAESAGDDMWQLNASVLIAQTEVKMKEYQSALESFEKVLDMAKVQGDEAAEAAIKKAIEDVNQKIVQSMQDDEEKPSNESVKDPSPPPKEPTPPPREPSPPPKDPTPPPKEPTPPPREPTPPSREPTPPPKEPTPPPREPSPPPREPTPPSREPTPPPKEPTPPPREQTPPPREPTPPPREPTPPPREQTTTPEAPAQAREDTPPPKVPNPSEEETRSKKDEDE